MVNKIRISIDPIRILELVDIKRFSVDGSLLIIKTNKVSEIPLIGRALKALHIDYGICDWQRTGSNESHLEICIKQKDMKNAFPLMYRLHSRLTKSR